MTAEGEPEVGADRDGRRVHVAALAEGQRAAWSSVYEQISDAPTPASNALVRTMFDTQPDLFVWLDVIEAAGRDARSEWGSGITKRATSWFLDGIIEALDPDHPTALLARTERYFAGATECGLEELQRIEELIRRDDPSGERHFDLLIALSGELSAARRTEEALRCAGDAARIGEHLDDTFLAALSTRVRGATLLRAGRVADALATLRPVMHERVPVFGAPGLAGTLDANTPIEHALEEAARVAMWASALVPEWVRALGALAERSQGANTGANHWDTYGRALSDLAQHSKKPIADLEVVARQATERGCDQAAALAIQRVNEIGVSGLLDP